MKDEKIRSQHLYDFLGSPFEGSHPSGSPSALDEPPFQVACFVSDSRARWPEAVQTQVEARGLGDKGRHCSSCSLGRLGAQGRMHVRSPGTEPPLLPFITSMFDLSSHPHVIPSQAQSPAQALSAPWTIGTLCQPIIETQTSHQCGSFPGLSEASPVSPAIVDVPRKRVRSSLMPVSLRSQHNLGQQ